jgi:hypothetical protein
MSDPLKPLKEALVVATAKLNEFVAARAEIDKQRAAIDTNIVRYKQIVDSLKTVCPDEEEENDDPSDVVISSLMAGTGGRQKVKFTDGVRMVLREYRHTAVTAPEIRDGLTNLGFEFHKYRQPLTPIHNCLKRLEDQGEVKRIETEDGQTLGYRWISPIEQALAEETPPSFAEELGLIGTHLLDGKEFAEIHRATVEAAQRAATEQAQMIVEIQQAAIQKGKESAQLMVDLAMGLTKKPKKG